MHNNLRNHAGQKELIQAQRKAESSPIMAILHGLEAVALEIHGTVKVHLMEGLHRDLALAMISGAIMLVVEVQVVLDRAAGVFGLLVLARRD